MAEKIAVLVVEDEPITRMDVVEQLEESGFKVFEAPDADRAIKILEANSAIRVLFTDIDMPGSMDGLKLAAAVRDRWPPIRIVVASGLRKINVDSLPADSRFFTKPYNVMEVDREHALPLGLVANEVVSNAMKYAFQDGRDGALTVTLKKSEDGRMGILTIHDNGAGFDPESISKGTGSRLVSGLAAQIQGETGYTFDSGTKFEMRFPLPNASA